MQMGQRRLAAWGLDPSDIPLGRYIYDASASGHDPIYRIGMLGFFETKNIGKKKTRARTFGSMGDRMSQRDMQFDWADETMHAEYGRRWLKRLLEIQGRPAGDYASVLNECEALVSARVSSADSAELEAVRARSLGLLAPLDEPDLLRQHSTLMSPLAELQRRSPVTRPTQVAPFRFLSTAGPSISRTRSCPDPVISVRPCARPTVTRPAPVVRCTGPASSSWM